jgi:hypothetical protein
MIRLMLAASLALVAAPAFAQDGIRIRSDQGTVTDHGAAAPAERSHAIAEPEERTDDQAILDALDQIALALNDGSLSDEEREMLIERARLRLEREMRRVDEREERQGESEASRRDRYRVSFRALERDLLYRIGEQRRAAGPSIARRLDDLDDRVRETFSNLHRKLAESPEGTWQQLLKDARKFHEGFRDDIERWGKEAGAEPEIMDVPQRITDMKRQLRQRLRQIRRAGGNKIEDQLDDLEERLLATYEGLERRIRNTAPANWGELLETAERFYQDYSQQLDRWAREAGLEDGGESPLHLIEELRDDLRQRVNQLRRVSGDDAGQDLDAMEERLRRSFDDLLERARQAEKRAWPELRAAAQRHHEVMLDVLRAVQRRLEAGADHRDSPDRDVQLPPGEHMDVIEGVRVARLMPLPRRQLGLENGLSVNEIVDADKALARAGLEVYDIILKVDGVKVDSRMELRNAMNAVEKDAEFKLEIMRAGKQIELKGKK